MFLIDWIYDYMNTPAYDMTAEIEALYYAALAIIFVGAVAIVAVIAFIINIVKKLKNESRETHGNQRTRKQIYKR